MFGIFRKPTIAADDGLDWLIRNFQGFAIRRSGDVQCPFDVKALAELAFLLTILARHQLLCRRARQLAARALAAVGDFDWHNMAALDPSAATVVATIGRFCHAFGAVQSFEPDYLRFLLDIGYFDAMDRVPHRQMDLNYSLAGIGIDSEKGGLRECYLRTCAGQGQSSVRYSIHDIYSLTHAIFYLSDVGCAPQLPDLSSAEADRLREQLVIHTVALMRIDNIDVLGELLLCWVMTRVPATPFNRRIFAVAMARVRGAVLDNGAIAPTREIQRMATPDFQLLYHTTLVAVMLFRMEDVWLKQ
jgi:hypothetical protein